MENNTPSPEIENELTCPECGRQEQEAFMLSVHLEVDHAVESPGDYLRGYRMGRTRSNRKAVLAEYKKLWAFWIDPGNDDVEVEEMLKTKLSQLEAEDTQ